VKRRALNPIDEWPPKRRASLGEKVDRRGNQVCRFGILPYECVEPIIDFLDEDDGPRHIQIITCDLYKLYIVSTDAIKGAGETRRFVAAVYSDRVKAST